MMGSGVWAGLFDEAATKALKDEDGTTVGEALAAIGFQGPEPAAPFPPTPCSSCISNRARSWREDKKIGVVTGAHAQIWYEATVTGQDSHAGTTPPVARRDALLTAARIIELVNTTMRETGDTSIADPGRGTVGRLYVLPNSPNVIPGEVRFTIDFRNPDDRRIVEISETFPAKAQAIAAANGCSLELRTVFRVKEQPFDAGCVALVRAAAEKLGYGHRDIVSGAGHDAVHAATILPTAMIFTPCKDGLSHNEAESILPEEAEAGTQVLFEAILARANRTLE